VRDDQVVPALEDLRALLGGHRAPGGKAACAGLERGARVGAPLSGRSRTRRSGAGSVTSKRRPFLGFAPAADEVAARQEVVSADRQDTFSVLSQWSAIARPTSSVWRLPPRSGVRGPRAMTCSIAVTIASCAARPAPCPCVRKSSISAPDQIIAIGLAMRLP
jgi:hypothetical protein